MKLLSLITNVLDSHEMVRRQLIYLERILTPECELILVDDGSTRPLREVCDSVPKSYSFTLHETHDSRPWTQPRARNLGAALAQSAKLLFFDIDHIITESVLAACLRYSGDKLHWLRRPAILDEFGNLLIDKVALVVRGVSGEVSGVHANSFMIRRELFQRLGGYDERFCGRYGGDDVDFNARYDRLCVNGLAWPVEVRGEGFVYPGDGPNEQHLFHSLSRGASNHVQGQASSR